MSVRSPKDLIQALKQGRIEPVYFLYGPETYLRDQAAGAIADEALRDTLLREFNDSSFSMTTDDARDVVAAAEQLPMMSSRRVVRRRSALRWVASSQRLGGTRGRGTASGVATRGPG